MGKPLCPSCKGEEHEPMDVIRLKLHNMVKEVVTLLICKDCGTVFDPRYVREHEL